MDIQKRAMLNKDVYNRRILKLNIVNKRISVFGRADMEARHVLSVIRCDYLVYVFKNSFCVLLDDDKVFSYHEKCKKNTTDMLLLFGINHVHGYDILEVVENELRCIVIDLLKKEIKRKTDLKEKILKSKATLKAIKRMNLFNDEVGYEINTENRETILLRYIEAVIDKIRNKCYHECKNMTVEGLLGAQKHGKKELVPIDYDDDVINDFGTIHMFSFLTHSSDDPHSHKYIDTTCGGKDTDNKKVTNLLVVCKLQDYFQDIVSLINELIDFNMYYSVYPKSEYNNKIVWEWKKVVFLFCSNNSECERMQKVVNMCNPDNFTNFILTIDSHAMTMQGRFAIICENDGDLVVIAHRMPIKCSTLFEIKEINIYNLKNEVSCYICAKKKEMLLYDSNIGQNMFVGTKNMPITLNIVFVLVSIKPRYVATNNVEKYVDFYGYMLKMVDKFRGMTLTDDITFLYVLMPSVKEACCFASRIFDKFWMLFDHRLQVVLHHDIESLSKIDPWVTCDAKNILAKIAKCGMSGILFSESVLEIDEGLGYLYNSKLIGSYNHIKYYQLDMDC